ncbi:MAG: EamA family transporter [Deltaproteobacteria bacterium]|nr:EamA family transporter [Deltaproteobacteria bacterium]
MMSWYFFSIAALFLMGTQRFLYKVSAERGCNTAWTTFSFMATVTVLSLAGYLIIRPPIADISALLLIAFLNSASFAMGTISHMEALKHLPAGIVYPIIRLNAVIVVMGIIVAMTVIYILTRSVQGEKGTYGNRRWGFGLVAMALVSGALVSGAFASVTSKFATIYTDKIAFMAVSYFLGTLFSFGLRKRLETEESRHNLRDALLIGLIMGLINFVGFYSFLTALSTGPMSVIISIMGMHFVIGIILSAMIYKETLTGLRILGIGLTIVSVLLLRL